MGHGFLKQAPIKTALLWLSCTLGLQRAGCETAISCISKNRFYKTKSPKQTTSNAFGQTVEKYDSVKKSALYWIWKAILSVHCDIYSDTLVGAHLRAHAHMLNEHKRGSNPLCSISHIPCTSTLSGQWVKKIYIYILKINTLCWRQNIRLCIFQSFLYLSFITGLVVYTVVVH